MKISLARNLGFLVLMALTTLLLTACSHQGKVGKVNGDTVTQEQFEDYLKFKHLPTAPGAQYGAVLDQYLQRKALADEIADQAELDKGMTEAELEDFRTQ